MKLSQQVEKALETRAPFTAAIVHLLRASHALSQALVVLRREDMDGHTVETVCTTIEILEGASREAAEAIAEYVKDTAGETNKRKVGSHG